MTTGNGPEDTRGPLLRRSIRTALRLGGPGTFGLATVALVVAVAIAAPLISPHDPLEIEPLRRLEPGSLNHPFGRDNLGRDLFSRVIHGARPTLLISLTAVAMGLVIGTALGGLAGYVGGWIDDVIMRAQDVLMAYPAVFLGLAVVSILGPNTTNLVVAVGVVAVPRFARLCRSSVLSIRERDYVLSAQVAGCTDIRIFMLHVLPNSTAPLIVLATTYFSTALVQAAGLSFLGLGVQPPTPEWGLLLSDGRLYLLTAPHLAVWPGLAISLTILAFQMFGDGLRDYLDPRLRER